ncbi:MAG: response regulator [Desulfobacterales bacterium]|nr:response regulator [Desulfobacterales bacterium]
MKFRRSGLELGTSTYGAALQDREGFIWFATMGNGLIRYDGYELKPFGQAPDMLSGSMVSSLAMDKSGTLWIATFTNGITQYDKQTNRFVHHRHDPDNENSISTDNIPFSPQALFVDSTDTLWAGSDNGGLNRLDPDRKKWTRFIHTPGQPNSITGNTVNAVIEDDDGMIWVGTSTGLNRFDPGRNIWVRYTHDPSVPGSISDNWINCLLKDRDGNIWAGTNSGGLNRFVRGTNSFEKFEQVPGCGNCLSSNNIWNLFEDLEGNIWINHYGATETGLEMFDPKTKTFTRYSDLARGTYSVSSRSVPGMIQDRYSGILFAINGGGDIDIFDPNAPDILSIQHQPDNPDSLSNNIVIPVLEDRRGIIWMGTGGGGLNSYDPATKTISRFMPGTQSPPHLPNAYITALREDRRGRIWVGSADGNLSLFDPGSGKVLNNYRNVPGDPHAITAAAQVKYIIEDKDRPEVLWVATIKGGLDRFNLETETFSHYKHEPDNPNSLSANSIVSLYDDGRGKLWIATYGGGLDILDKETGRFSHFTHDPDLPDSISSNTIYEVLEDSKSRIWISGKKGISRFNPATETFTNYSRFSGITNPLVGSLIEDNRNYLWLGTVNKGLIRFDPETGESLTLSRANGLPTNAIFWTSRAKTTSGQLWFGGKNGAFRLNPEKISSNPFIPPVRLTALKQGGKDIKLSHAPERVDQITLDWNMNYFEFQFTALNFSDAHNNRYAYMLEGRDTEWYYSGSQPFGRYTGLEGGTYTLKFKGSNNDGLWNEDGGSVTIIVKSPFWKTRSFSFIILVSCLMAGGFIFFYLHRLRNEVKDRKHAQKALQENEALLRKIAENYPHSYISLINREFRIEFTSGREFKNSHRDPEQIVGRTLDQIFGEKAKKIKAQCELTFNGEETAFEFSIDNAHHYCQSVPLYSEDGAIDRILMVIENITEKKTLEERLRQSEKMEAIGTLAGGIAHDFNNILSPILGYTELIQEDLEPDSPLQRKAAEIFKAALRAKELVHQILTFSRQTEHEIKPLEVQLILKEAVKLLRASLPKTIDIQLRVDHGCGRVLADPTQIHRIIMNLGTNAYHAMQASGGVLTFDLRQSQVPPEAAGSPPLPNGKYVRMEVSDTGIGIEEKDLEKIFDPYFTTKGKDKGTGLGLSVVQGIVQSFNGGIRVQSVSGKGTRIFIYLPELETDSPKKQTETFATRIPGGNERILLVDDEPAIIQVQNEILRRLGYDVTAMTESLKALQLFRSTPDRFDLIISDMTMPRMTGLQLAGEIKKINPATPFILCSGFSENINRDNLEKMGVDGYIAKPIEKRQIALGIRKLLDG